MFTVCLFSAFRSCESIGFNHVQAHHTATWLKHAESSGSSRVWTPEAPGPGPKEPGHGPQVAAAASADGMIDCGSQGPDGPPENSKMHLAFDDANIPQGLATGK